MRKHHLLFAVLAAGAAAALWFFRPNTLDGPEPTDCGTVSECTVPVPVPATGDAEPAPAETPEQSTTPDPAAAPPREGHGERSEAGKPALTVADGIRLREDYERLMAEKRGPEAIAALRLATEADPSARNHGELGSLLQKLTAFDEAARHLRAAAELDPGNADRWIALANVYYLKVDPGKAWQAERRAKEAEPGLVLARGPDGLRIRAGAPPPPAP